MSKKHLLLIAGAIVLIVAGMSAASLCDVSLTHAQTASAWGQYVNLSNGGLGIQGTEPKVAADAFGYVHVFWTGRNDSGSAIYYARRRDAWEGPVDIIFAPNALVTAAAVDVLGYVHMIWMSNSQLFHSRAHISDALSAQNWDVHSAIGEHVPTASSFAADIVVDARGVLHVAFGDAQSANVYVVRSEDGGLSWTEPIPVGEVGQVEVQEAATEVRLASDRDSGQLHVTWTTREIPRGWPGRRLFYSRSIDGGISWSSPELIDESVSGEYAEDRGPFFPALAVRTDREVHLTWSGAPRGERWHQWSSDGGISWHPRTAIAVLNDTAEGMGMPGTTGFTDLAVDSANTLYAVTTIGDSGAPRLVGWASAGWGGRLDSPYPGGDCEDPRVVVTEGNVVHIACVEQGGLDSADIWYVSMDTASPMLSVKPVPTIQGIQPAATPINLKPTDVPISKLSAQVSASYKDSGSETRSSQIVFIFAILPSTFLVIGALFVILHRKPH